MADLTRVEQALDRAAAAHPDRAALIHGERCWTYREVVDESWRRAGVLVGAGLRAGDFAVIVAPVTADLILTFLGCCRAAVIPITLSPRLAAPELDALCAIARPAAFIAPGAATGQSHAPLALPLALPGIPAPADLEEVRRRGARGTAADPAWIRATSGTTGARPKLVVKPHRQLTWQETQRPWWWGPGMVTSCHSPEHFTGNAIVRVFVDTETLVLADGTPGELEATWARHGVTQLFTVPALLGLLARQEAPPPPTLRLAVIRATAAPLSPDDNRAIAKRYGARIVQEYALAECRVPLAPLRPETPPGSVGEPTPGTEIRLLDSTGAPVADGEAGEIVIRNPGIMLGYLHDPEATAAVLRDGWLHTGDTARRDHAGFYYLEGRRGLRINVGGSKVAPEEVEAVLLRHPGVREAVAVAMPDATRGEVVRAIVVPANDPPPAPDELRRHCRAHLASYKVPRVVEFRESLPRSPLGKVLRQQL